jgi:CBS domain-containing membrane protein
MTTFAYPLAQRPMMLRSLVVADLMTHSPLAFEKQMPIPKAAALLQFNGLDAAPVIDEHRRLVGIVTSASCAAWEEFSLRSAPHGFSLEELDSTPLWEISSPIIESVREDGPADEVIDRLAERRARRIYVVNDRDELVGVVSVADLIRHLTQRVDGQRVSRAGAALLC